jgi:purine-binding chemotaxis protein CheW
MDLAKIRKKALQARTDGISDPVCREAPASGQLQAVSGFTTAHVPSVLDDPVELLTVESIPSTTVLPAVHFLAGDPLKIILAGRQAAGCYDEFPSTDDGTSNTVFDESPEFLCFRVSDEIYGINIMDIKEIIKPREVTEVPRAPAFVSGILSLRGTIITIIDMRLRLGLHRENVSSKERVVVVRNGESFCGLLVDEVIQVVRVGAEAMEQAPAVLDGIDRDFVSGLGRTGGKLIIILNLESITDIHHY